MCEKQLNCATQTPIAMRVKFLKGSQPGKVNIKVIWASSSQHDLMSTSNSLVSVPQCAAIKGQISPAALKKKHPHLDEEDSPVVIEDVPEVANSNRTKNLSQKMHEMIN